MSPEAPKQDAKGFEEHFGPLAEIQLEKEKEFQEHFEGLAEQVEAAKQPETPKPQKEDAGTEQVQPQAEAAEVKEEKGQSANEIGIAAVEGVVAAVEEESKRTPKAAENPKPTATPEADGLKKAVETFGTIRPGDSDFHYSLEEIAAGAEAAPNHNIIGRFGARLERMGIKLVNAPQNIALGTIENWYSKRAAVAEGRHEEHKRELAEAETKLGTLDKSIELARTAGDPKFDVAYAAKMNKERRDLVNKIEKAKTNLNAAHVALEHYNGKKTTWESRQNNLAEKIVGEIDKRLRPSREVFAELAGKNERVTKEIDKLKQLKEKGEARFKELHAQLANNPPAKGEIRIKLAKVEEKLRLINEDYEQFTKAQSRIGAKMNNANTYLGQWDVMRNEQLRVTSKDNRYAEPGVQTQAERKENREPVHSHAPDISEPKVVVVPQAKTEEPAQFKTPEAGNNNEPVESAGQAVDGGNEPTPPGGAAARPLTVEDLSELPYSPRLNAEIELTPEEQETIGGLETTPQEYIEIWNKLYGNEYMIDPKDFAKANNTGLTNKLPLQEFEAALGSVLLRLRRESKLVYLPKAVLARLERIRKEYTLQAQKKAA